MVQHASRLFAVLIILSTFQFVTASPAAQQGCPAPRLTVGGQGRVLPGSPNRVRDSASTSGTQVGEIPGGAVFDVLDGPVCAEGYNWWQVDYSGLTGYTVEGNADSYFVEPVAQAVSPSATTTPPSSNAACPANIAPEPQLVAGTFGVVVADNPIRLRAQPSTSAEQLSLINPRFQFIVLDGPVCAEGYNWWHVEDEGVEGWIAEGSDGDYFVQPVAATATPRPTRTFFPTSLPTSTYTPSQTFTPSRTLTPSNTPTQTPTLLNHPYSVSWSADGALLAVASDDGVLLYDTTAFQTTPEILAQYTYFGVAFSPTDPDLLVAVPPRGDLEVWNVEDREIVTHIGGFADSTLSFSTDGARLAVAVNNGVDVYDTATWELVAQIDSELEIAALSPDGTQFAYSTRVDGAFEVVLAPVDDPENIQILDRGEPENPFGVPTVVIFNPDGLSVALADSYANLQVWDLDTFERTSLIRRANVVGVTSTDINALAYSPDGESLVTGEANPQGIVRVLNSHTLEQVDAFGINTGDTAVVDLAFKPEGTLLAVVVDNTVRILDTENYEQVVSLIIHP